MDPSGLTPQQMRKLAALTARGACYVVREGNALACLVHQRPAETQKRCATGRARAGRLKKP